MNRQKLSLRAFELGAKEVLTREQLKKVLGGGNCGVMINGQWRQITSTSGSGCSTTQCVAVSYVNNGYATNYCCDSCSHW